MTSIRVLIVDDVPQVRQGLRALLPLIGETTGLWLEIVGEAGNGLEAIEQCLALLPDVVLMDIEMPVLDGYAATRSIKTHCPATRVVALTVHGDPTARQKAREAGVDQLIEKGAPLPVLVRAVLGDPSQDQEARPR